MKRSQISKAVKIALAGSALAFGAVSTASAHTMYNMFNLNVDGHGGETDGWVYGGTNITSAAAGGVAGGGTPFGWVGTGGNTLINFAGSDITDQAAFGYQGSSHLNWGAMLHGAGASLEVSRADSFARYGINADIDTAGGAWQDTGQGVVADIQGWKHNVDIGLIKTDTNQTVNLNISAVNGPIANFGVTIFSGMDTNTGSYSHHGAWNDPDSLNAFGLPDGHAYDLDNPFGTTGLTHMKYDGTVDSTAGGTISFDAVAGEIYTIYLGGNGGLHWNQQHDNYVLDITTSPSAVPVPAAAWLLGSGLIGLFSYGRRKNTAVEA